MGTRRAARSTCSLLAVPSLCPVPHPNAKGATPLTHTHTQPPKNAAGCSIPRSLCNFHTRVNYPTPAPAPSAPTPLLLPPPGPQSRRSETQHANQTSSCSGQTKPPDRGDASQKGQSIPWAPEQAAPQGAACTGSQGRTPQEGDPPTQQGSPLHIPARCHWPGTEVAAGLQRRAEG